MNRSWEWELMMSTNPWPPYACNGMPSSPSTYRHSDGSYLLWKRCFFSFRMCLFKLSPNSHFVPVVYTFIWSHSRENFGGSYVVLMPQLQGVVQSLRDKNCWFRKLNARQSHYCYWFPCFSFTISLWHKPRQTIEVKLRKLQGRRKILLLVNRA